MLRHPEVENAPTVVCQHQEQLQDLKSDRRYCEKVDGHHVPDVVIEERPPRLGRWLSVTEHLLGNRGFGNLNAEL